MGKKAANATKNMVVFIPMPNQIMANGSQLIPGTDLNPLIVLLMSFCIEARRPDIIPSGIPNVTATAKTLKDSYK